MHCKMLRAPVKPVPLASFQKTQLKFFPEVFEEALNRKHLADIPVVVLASNGPSRTGKSFFLNQIIKYCKYGSEADWLSRPLDGFKWKGDTDCVTSGILLWPEPFIIEDPITKSRLALLLLDNQGLGEEGVSYENETKLVCLSYMCSSIFTYNIRDILSKDAFKELHRLATASNNVLQAISTNKSGSEGRMDQKEYNRGALILRCIDFPESEKYLVDGSHFFGPDTSLFKDNCLYKTLFENDEKLSDQSVRYRNTLRESFSEIHLLCSKGPGNKAPMNQQQFDSVQYKLDEDFEKGLKKSIPKLCSYEFLYSKTKLIGGERVTGNFIGKILSRLVRELDKQDFKLEHITAFDMGPHAYYHQKQIEHNHMYDTLANDELHQFSTVGEFNDFAFERIKQNWLKDDIFGAPGNELKTFMENLTLYANDREEGINQRLLMYKAPEEVNKLKGLLEDEAKRRTEFERLTEEKDKQNSAELKRYKSEMQAKDEKINDTSNLVVKLESQTQNLQEALDNIKKEKEANEGWFAQTVAFTKEAGRVMLDAGTRQACNKAFEHYGVGAKKGWFG